MTTATHFLFLAQTPSATDAAPAAPATTATTAATPATGAATAPSAQPGLLQSPAVPLMLMAVIFYFLLIRPQQKRAREAAALAGSLKTGDEVVTSSGIYGMITNVSPEEKAVTVKIAEGVKVKMSRDSVTTVLNRSAAAATPVVDSKPAAGGGNPGTTAKPAR